jgi:hypothetical protein
LAKTIILYSTLEGVPCHQCNVVAETTWSRHVFVENVTESKWIDAHVWPMTNVARPELEGVSADRKRFSLNTEAARSIEARTIETPTNDFVRVKLKSIKL